MSRAYANRIYYGLMQKLDMDGLNDAEPANFAFARTLCDLHCVRDIVKTGDKAILDSLERASYVMTRNTDMLLEYYVHNSAVDVQTEIRKQVKELCAATDDCHSDEMSTLQMKSKLHSMFLEMKN